MLWPRSMHTQLPASTEMLCGNFEVKHSERDKENSLAALPRRLTPTLTPSLFTRPPKSMNRLRNYHSSVRRAVSWTRIDNTATTYYLIRLPPLTLHLHLPPFICFSLLTLVSCIFTTWNEDIKEIRGEQRKAAFSVQVLWFSQRI